ncbi:RecD-like DNA helicase YrrC [Acetivibrio straminisolvens JCM 21531]|uniref:RecD-like DNA helicase YrrC n=1 Tax=Acetivibrio straminisolvens JCM 21531 TaxID=1294263 RepID=W4V4T0_9FIRM|nr:RecD-like DNA helicase YrrC [Acetivibrio straminisolvens JCM 21531]
MTQQEGTGVFNGDMGVIVEIDDEEQKIKVCFDDERLVGYDFTILDELEPAYAITIHKSQGSEFPVVILPVFPGPSVLMTRNLLYTAITRARELVILVGNRDCLFEMIMNDRETKRNSDLAEKLRKCVVGMDWLKQ